MTRPRPLLPLLSLTVVLLLLAVLPAVGQNPPSGTPKYGGVLVTSPLSADAEPVAPRGVDVATIQQASPCFNNLVYYDPTKKDESVDTIIPELAERWSWQDKYRNLVFFLRHDVKWHDGKPFTSQDVKYTFDMVRGAPEAKAKLKVNPRKLWYDDVDAIEAPDPYTVVFRLKHPQPSLLLMLASGYSPVYPAHVPLAEFKNRCIGTGPFKLKENKPGEYVEYVKNPDYFVKGRPYLDGIKFVVIRDRSTQIAAVQSGQLDVGGTGWNRPTRRTPRAARPSSSSSRPTPTSTTTCSSTSRAAVQRPADPARHQPGARPQGLPGRPAAGRRHVRRRAAAAPAGVWGLPAAEVAKLAGMGDPAKQKAEARKLLAEAGYRPEQSAQVHALDPGAVHLRGHRELDGGPAPAGGHRGHARADRDRRLAPEDDAPGVPVALNLTGIGIDDPDAQLFENYRCGSQRNFSGYCSEEIDRLMVRAVADDSIRRSGWPWCNEIDRKLAGRRRPADPGLGQAALGALAAREGLGHPRELDLQREPAPGRLAGQVGRVARAMRVYIFKRLRDRRRHPPGRCRCSSSSSCAWRPATSPT